MPIDTQCPHCRKAYLRLKDEMAGKRLTCANPDCRKVFTADARPSVGGPQSPAGGLAPAPSPASTAVAAPPPGGGTPAPMPKLPIGPTVADPTPVPPNKSSSKPPAKSGSKPNQSKVPVARKSSSRPPVDAEAVALKAFSDEAHADGAADAPKTVEMTCYSCEHKWTESWDKQGKNVLCPNPDCRHRQQVPIIKQEDWRTQNKPSLAKIDDVLPDVAMGDKREWVSEAALEKAGAIPEEDVEPRPRWHLFAVVTAVVALVAGVWVGLSAFRTTRIEEIREFSFKSAIDELEAHPDALPKPEMPLYRGALYMAFAEYAIRRSEPEKIGDAKNHFKVARQALATTPQSDERDVLFGDLLVGQVALGGDERQVENRVRLAWKRQVVNANLPRLGQMPSSVQTELQDTLFQMQNGQGGKVKADVRYAALRHLTRELCKHKQYDLLTGILNNGFESSEQLEAAAQLCLEVLRETKDADSVLKLALEKFEFHKAKAAPLSAVSLQKALNNPQFKPVAFIFADPAKDPKSPVSDTTRRIFVALSLTQNNVQEAIDLARRPGDLESRLNALSSVAECVADPAPAVQAAVEVLQADPPRAQFGKLPPVPGPALVRLVQAAARCGQREAADKLVAAIPDPSLKEWAKAEALRIRLRAATDRKPEDETVAPIPEHHKDYKLGHAWARLALARHNAAVTGGGNPSAYDGWKEFKPFGLAGLALGQQDRSTK